MNVDHYPLGRQHRRLLKHAIAAPVNERWLHEPAMKKKLARADQWMRNHPAKETDLKEFASGIETVL